jgi:glycine cleavage system H protein
MIRSESAKRLVKNSLLYLGLAIAVVAVIPLLAGLAFGARLLIPVALVAVLVALAVSPRFRRWFGTENDNASHYHGLTIPTASLWLHPAHGWVKVEAEGTATVGVDALAALALGAMDAVDPLPVGTRVKQGQTIFSLCRGQRRLEVKSPVGGIVGDVNREVVTRPALLIESPYGAGWVVALDDVHLGAERAGLMRGGAVRRWFSREVDRLTAMLSPSGAAATMADGGVLASDLSSHIDDARWNEIASAFFANTHG